MSCPGLHCPGCTEGQSLAITVAAVGGLVLAAETIQWVAERVFWIGGTMAACLVLSVAASMALEAWADRRGARFAAAHGILSRADVILSEPARWRAELVGEAAADLPHRPRAAAVETTRQPTAIENHVHYHVHVGEYEAAGLIRGGGRSPSGRGGEFHEREAYRGELGLEVHVPGRDVEG